MKLARTPSKRELARVQSADIHRVTRAGVMRHRGRNTRKWVGLPKPRSQEQFNPLPIVTNRILHKLGAEADPRIRKAERELRQKRRVEILEYLRTRGTGKLIA